MGRDNMLDIEQELPGQETRRWAMLCHLSGLTSPLLTPCVSIVVAVIVWLTKRNVSAYVDEQGREAINFQISMLIYGLLALAAVFVLKFVFIGYLFLWLPYIILLAQAGGSVVGAIRAYDGENFRYPLILRFL